MILKLKRTPGIYLVGFMASGKTTIGQALAQQIGWPFVDLDVLIEQREQKSIQQIFADAGEGQFREIETEILKKQVRRIETGQPCVLALGGGAFVQQRNWELVRDNGITLWLDCPIEIVERRLGGDTTRPLAANRNGLGKLYEDRRPLYARADYRVEVDTDDAAVLLERIMHLPLFKK